MAFGSVDSERIPVLERLGTALSIGDNPLPLGVALKISQVAIEAR
jgi:hypothetical protein